MTKKMLLKWLERQKAEALATVETKKTNAKKALLTWKQEQTKLEILADELYPHIQFIVTRLDAWYDENADICGTGSASYWNSLRGRLAGFRGSKSDLITALTVSEFTHATADDKLAPKYSDLRSGVLNTYATVTANATSMPTAKDVAEYLTSLGFDIATLEAREEKAATTALAAPVNTAFLMLKKEEEQHDTN